MPPTYTSSCVAARKSAPRSTYRPATPNGGEVAAGALVGVVQHLVAKPVAGRAEFTEFQAKPGQDIAEPAKVLLQRPGGVAQMPIPMHRHGFGERHRRVPLRAVQRYKAFASALASGLDSRIPIRLTLRAPKNPFDHSK